MVLFKSFIRLRWPPSFVQVNSVFRLELAHMRHAVRALHHDGFAVCFRDSADALFCIGPHLGRRPSLDKLTKLSRWVIGAEASLNPGTVSSRTMNTSGSVTPSTRRTINISSQTWAVRSMAFKAGSSGIASVCCTAHTSGSDPRWQE